MRCLYNFKQIFMATSSLTSDPLPEVASNKILDFTSLKAAKRSLSLANIACLMWSFIVAAMLILIYVIV